MPPITAKALDEKRLTAMSPVFTCADRVAAENTVADRRQAGSKEIRFMMRNVRGGKGVMSSRDVFDQGSPHDGRDLRRHADLAGLRRQLDAQRGGTGDGGSGDSHGVVVEDASTVFADARGLGHRLSLVVLRDDRHGQRVALEVEKVLV